MPDESYLDPRLPQDLERIIFVQCASDWLPKFSSRLSLVAKRVHEWLRPIFFQVFKQAMSPYFPDFNKHLSLKLEDVGGFAKHLIIGISHSREEINLLLSSCPNVFDLAMWCGEEAFKDSFPAIQRLPLTRLSAALDELNPEDFSCPVFGNLTHLDIVGYRYDWDQWVPLTALPKLSHIAINSTQQDPAIIPNLLLRCPQLQTLVMMLEPDNDWVHRKPGELFDTDDDRLVLMTSSTHDLMVEDWENGANGIGDFWTLAERFTLARRGDYLRDPSQRWIKLSFDWEDELNPKGEEWYQTLMQVR